MTRPIDLKFSGKKHFHENNIHVKFGCKRPSMLKVIAPYSTTTEPKLARCQPRAQRVGNHPHKQLVWCSGTRVRLLGSTCINSQSSWCTGFKFSDKIYNDL